MPPVASETIRFLELGETHNWRVFSKEVEYLCRSSTYTGAQVFVG